MEQENIVEKAIEPCDGDGIHIVEEAKEAEDWNAIESAIDIALADGDLQELLQEESELLPQGQEEQVQGDELLNTLDKLEDELDWDEKNEDDGLSAVHENDFSEENRSPSPEPEAALNKDPFKVNVVGMNAIENWDFEEAVEGEDYYSGLERSESELAEPPAAYNVENAAEQNTANISDDEWNFLASVLIVIICILFYTCG